jgi:hypothetical protein
MWLTAGLLVVAFAITLATSLAETGGHVSYALDDAYIQMAIARTFAEHGVWGVSHHGFTSSSSSLLWAATLSGLFRLLGSWEWIPLLLNLGLALITLRVADHHLRAALRQPWLRAAFLLAVCFFPPLPALIFTGQEHVLQTLLCLLFVPLAARDLSADGASGNPSKALMVLGPLTVLVRFEGLFQVFLVCCAFLLRRPFRAAISRGALCLAPLVLFGAYSVAQGWYPLPNSILMKGNLTDILVGLLNGDPTDSSFYQSLAALLGYAAYQQLLRAPHLLFLTLTALVTLTLRCRQGKGLFEEKQLLLLLFLLTTLFHMELAKIGAFFRYEAYLVALGLMAIASTLGELPTGAPSTPTLSVLWLRRFATAALLAFPLVALGVRGLEALTQTPTATVNIHQQQYQVGRFLATHYAGEAVSANDIGAINFLADVRCVDLVGLAHMGAARRRRHGRFDRESMHELSRQAGARVAVVYEPWIVKWGGIPEAWTRVGTWTIPNNVVAGLDTVTFFALVPAEVEPLQQKLRAFSAMLPGAVAEGGAYLR